MNKFEPGSAETSQGLGVNKFGPYSKETSQVMGVNKFEPSLSETSQGPGVNKFGPSSPPDRDGHHCPKRPKLSSESRANLHEQCERFFIGDEVAKPTRYRVYGTSESARLLERRG